MPDTPLTELVDPSRNLPLDDWLQLIEDIGEDNGYFEPLGPDHSAIFIDKGPVLLVTFEAIPDVRGHKTSDVPLGWRLAEQKNWSQLCILSHQDTWFRHRALYGFFDRLVDDGFFDNYDHVVFYGSGPCGYGAAAYSVAAPGATVIALNPQATLDPRVAEWDARFEHMRRVSFSDRYGYAPDMLEAADRAIVLYDPEIAEDSAHAALFTRPNVTKIRCRYLGDEIEKFLLNSKSLPPLIDKAMAGRLTPDDFYRQLRKRRSYMPYLQRFLGAVEEQQRPFLTALTCRSVLTRIDSPGLRRKLTRAQTKYSENGLILPRARARAARPATKPAGAAPAASVSTAEQV